MIDQKNIRLIRFLTGEEIIAEVVLDTEKVLTIKNPIRVLVIPNQSAPNNPNIGFAPWSEFTEDKTFDLNKDHILVQMTPIKQFIAQYMKTFSPIITPQSGGIILPS